MSCSPHRNSHCSRLLCVRVDLDIPKLTRSTFALPVWSPKEGADFYYFADFGVDPYVYVAETPSFKRKLLSGTWVVNSEQGLEVAAAQPNASKIEGAAAARGGRAATIL